MERVSYGWIITRRIDLHNHWVVCREWARLSRLGRHVKRLNISNYCGLVLAADLAGCRFASFAMTHSSANCSREVRPGDLPKLPFFPQNEGLCSDPGTRAGEDNALVVPGNELLVLVFAEYLPWSQALEVTQ